MTEAASGASPLTRQAPSAASQPIGGFDAAAASVGRAVANNGPGCTAKDGSERGRARASLRLRGCV